MLDCALLIASESSSASAGSLEAMRRADLGPHGSTAMLFKAP